MESIHTSQMPRTVSQAASTERAIFIKKTYMHLAGALLAFVGVEYLFLQIPALTALGLKMTQGFNWLIVLGVFMFATSMAEKWAHNSTSRNKQYAGLGLYIIAQAFIFIPLMYVAQNFTGDGNIIAQAGLLTGFLFTGLTAVVFFTGKDFSFLRTGLMIGSMVALGLIVASVIFGFSLGLVFSFAMIVLASGSILYQTSNLMNSYRTDQYVAASLGLFASFMLLLWYVMRILISLQSND